MGAPHHPEPGGSMSPATLAAIGGWPGLLGRLTSGQELRSDEARVAMAEILDGAATPAQIAGFAIAMRMKGETVGELSGLLDAVYAAAAIVPLDDDVRDRAVDVVGTGGDRSHTINVSTLAALVVAGAGVPVAKHGNRAASSACGAADLLEALGVVIDLGPEGVARCVREVGMGFCFAPRFHPAFRHAGPPRRELGVPTVFNMLGPLASPARARRHLIGVADARMAEKVASVLAARGAIRAMVVHGHGGLDELSTTGPSTVYDVIGGAAGGAVTAMEIDPVDLGIAPASLADLVGGDPATNAGLARAVLAGARGPHRDIVVLNAGAALVVGDAAPDLDAGMALAGQVIDSGAGAATLARLVEVSTAVRAGGEN